MTTADVHFGNMLNQWQQYTEGGKTLPSQDSLQKLVTDALKDLEQADKAFQQQMDSNDINKIAICKFSTMTETISRIAQCLLHNAEWLRSQSIDPAITKERMEHVTQLEKNIHEKILSSSSIEIMPSFTLEKLRLLPRNF